MIKTDKLMINDSPLPSLPVNIALTGSWIEIS